MYQSGSSGAAGPRPRAPWGGWWAGRPVLLRGLAIVALAWMGAYLVWRVGWSLRDANPVLWAVLLATELFGWWSLAILTWFGWSLRPSVRAPATPGRLVDIYVCTYDEPLSVLRATLAGCAALAYPHTTYVLDDGRRAEVAALAGEWDALYLTRAGNAHAKAGNINAALPRTAGELVLVLDADHVPLPDMLDAVIGTFDDPRVALVQTPHDFSNHDSIQHYEVGRHEQSIFYGVVCPGKDRHNAAFWCGSGAVIRRDALLGAGGVATETIAEDFHTTIRLHRGGWRTRYHDEILVQGLAPHDLAAYLLQRDRWARGNLAVFTTPESPLRARELTPLQRLSYFASLSSYLAGPMRLVMLAVLAAVLWTGALPLYATPTTIALLWAPSTILAIAAGTALGRGYQTLADTTHFELLTAEIHARALRCVVRPGRGDFKVTPKEGVDTGGWPALRQLRLLLVVSAALALGLVARLLAAAGVLAGLPPLDGLAFWLVPPLATIELLLVLRTLLVVAARRQRRETYRVPFDGPAVLDDGVGSRLVGRGLDLTPAGAGLLLPRAVAEGTRCALALHLRDRSEPARAWVRVRSCRPARQGWVVGARIESGSLEDMERIVAYCSVTAAWRRLREDEAVPAPASGDDGGAQHSASAAA